MYMNVIKSEDEINYFTVVLYKIFQEYFYIINIIYVI